MSSTITQLRFPLAAGVVFLHYNISGGVMAHGEMQGTDMPLWCHWLINLLSGVLPHICVPLFFLVSGYLFFRSGFTIALYKRKISRRVRSLLAPYIVWNLIAVAYFWLRTLPFMSSFQSVSYKADWTPLKFLACFYDSSCGVFSSSLGAGEGVGVAPQDGPLWFVRDLMVVMLLTPIIHHGLRKFSSYFVGALCVAWYAAVIMKIGWPSQLLTAAFFFTWGAWYAHCGRDFVSSMCRYRVAAWFYPLLALTVMITKGTPFGFALQNFALPFGVVAVVSLGAYSVKNNGGGEYLYNLSDASFFVFAAHAMLLVPMSSFVVNRLFIDSPWFMTLLFFVIPSATIAISLCCYWLLKRFAPRFCSLLTGGR